jgi:hypothetical protein
MRTLFAAVTAALLGFAGTASSQLPIPSAFMGMKHMDTNRDGSISKSEWLAAGQPIERFAFVDANKDGKISLEELAAALAAKAKHQSGQ